MARAAIFDVDGTLADTNYPHVTSWWQAFRGAGHQVAMSDIHRAIGLGSGDLIAHLLGDDRDHDQDDPISAAHSTLYGTYFGRLTAFESAADLLRVLAEQGWTNVLASSATGPELDALRRAIDADDVIAGTTSSGDVSQGKPAPDPVHAALNIAGVPAERAVFVGDAVWDMEAASRAGVRSVAVLSGGIPRDALEAAGADEVYENVADLLARLDSSLFMDLE
ncbi:HAD family hydrolase [Streptomyces sp. NPDC051217]|uniref:HAD family hydrolase n=1 Tax=Streptomyces sp. NPDC051217 TaxID=3365644 RepID=UPI0037AC1785